MNELIQNFSEIRHIKELLSDSNFIDILKEIEK
jgi:hypothetical protein